MKPRQIAIAATMLAAAGIGLAPPAGAMPAMAPEAGAPAAGSSGIVRVGSGHVSIGIHWHGGHVYYNNHRGHYRYRHGYRRHHGYWFPPGAFVVVVPRHGHVHVPRYRPPPTVRPRIIRLSHAHRQWCRARYRSYRPRDNTFQPYHGPRRPCVSPYY